MCTWLALYLSDNLYPSSTNWNAVARYPLLHHLMLYIQLIITCHIHCIQMNLQTKEGM